MLRLKAVVLGFSGALVFSAVAQAADAAWRPAPADYSVLRGSQYDGEPTAQPPRFFPEWPAYGRWHGFYFGGQIGRDWVGADFHGATRSQISYILSNTELQNEVSGWTTLPKATAGGMTYGAFGGYNVQWADAVTGFEVNYHHVGQNISVRDSIGPILVASSDPSTTYSVTVASQAAVAIHELVTARARFAWAAGRFLPYIFVGGAVATAQTSSTADVTVFKAVTPPPILDQFGNAIPQPRGPFNPVTLPRNPQSNTRNQIAYGYTAGLGLDVAVTANVFVRAEWEYVGFMSMNDIKVNMNTGQVGVGVKF
jgi:opacity protein-like surface antigen